MLVGTPTLTGIASVLFAQSVIPTVNAPPPVTTIPDGVCPANPDLLISKPIIVKSSLRRGLIIPSTNVLFETFLSSSGKLSPLQYLQELLPALFQFLTKLQDLKRTR